MTTTARLGAALACTLALAAAAPAMATTVVNPGCITLTAPGDFATLLAPLDSATQHAQKVCYAEGSSWQERKFGTMRDTTLYQRFDYFRPAGAPLTQTLPLIIWAHPNGQNERLPLGSNGFNQLVAPAIAQGFALMSIEFRHPVGSQVADKSQINLDVPNTDVARAIQWARAWAGDLGIDPNNVFIVGQSRGTLGLLTALAPDQADPNSTVPYLKQSSRVNAVYAVQAQTTYEHDEVRDTFIVDADHAKFDLSYPFFHHPGSAIRQMSIDDPAIALRYDREPTDPQRRKVIPLYMAEKDGSCLYPAPGCFDEHHPNFGVALARAFVSAYVNAGLTPPPDKFDIAYNVPDASFYVDPATQQPYSCFFVRHLTPAGGLARRAAASPLAPACSQ